MRPPAKQAARPRGTACGSKYAASARVSCHSEAVGTPQQFAAVGGAAGRKSMRRNFVVLQILRPNEYFAFGVDE